MTWFTASFISATKFPNDGESSYLVYEDYYLFEANTQQEYNDKLDRAIDELKTKYSNHTYQNKPSQVEYVGIRKILTITNFNPNLDKEEDPPDDDCILSYNFLTTKTLNEAKQYAIGGEVFANYIDGDNQDN